MPQPDRRPTGSATDASAALGGDRVDCLSGRDGRLFVEDCDATGLVERFGSPIFVTSETQLRANLRRFRQACESAWPDGPVDVLPAFKANTTLATRHILSDEGAGADIYSPQELTAVLGTGVDPARVSVNGGGKSREHLHACVAAGVRITVEDVHEIDLIQEVAADLGATARVRFRVKPTVPKLWRRTDFSQLTIPIDLGIQVYKSGVPPEYLVDMGRRVFGMPNVDLVGLHLHAGRHPLRPAHRGALPCLERLATRGDRRRRGHGQSPRSPQPGVSPERVSHHGSRVPVPGRPEGAGGSALPRGAVEDRDRADRAPDPGDAAHHRSVRRHDRRHLFLGIIDAAYFWQTGLFARERGGVANAVVVAGVLALAVVLLVFSSLTP
jgi:hypothetical protein